MSYYIAKKEEYYGPDAKYGWVEEENTNSFGFGAARKFGSAEEAAAWIEEREGESYVLAHNEASRPEYLVLNEHDAYNLAEAWSHEDLGGSQYNWDHCADPENPTEDEECEAISVATAAAWDAVAGKS